MFNWLLVFVATLLVDFCWTRYNVHSAAKHAHRAAAWSAGIILFGFVNVVSYTADHWLVIPALLGAYAGTWVAIRCGDESGKAWRWIKAAIRWESRQTPPAYTREYAELFRSVQMHWSKDPAVPYANCACKVCEGAREWANRCTHRGTDSCHRCD